MVSKHLFNGLAFRSPLHPRAPRNLGQGAPAPSPEVGGPEKGYATCPLVPSTRSMYRLHAHGSIRSFYCTRFTLLSNYFPDASDSSRRAARYGR